MIKIGTIYELKFNSCMETPEWYFVVNKAEDYGEGYYNLCRTDYMLRGPKPSFTDFWVCSENYINHLLETGELKVTN